MNEIKNLLQDVQDNKMEIANLRLDQIIKDKITIAVEQQKIEVANKIFNEGLTNVSSPIESILNEAVKCPWKFRLDYMDRNNLKLIQTYAPGNHTNTVVGTKGQFDDSTWQDDLNKFKNKDQDGKLPPKAVAAKVPYMIYLGVYDDDIVIYGNSQEEIKKYINEYDSWNKTQY